MYEHLVNDLVTNLSPKFSSEDINYIILALDKSMTNYDIFEKETSIAIVQDLVPQEVKTFLVCKKISGLSMKTIKLYERTLRNFFISLDKRPVEITTADIRGYLFMYQQRRGCSNGTLETMRTIICNFFQWLQDEEYILRNPAKKVATIKAPIIEQVRLTDMELELMRQACKNVRERAIFETLYSTACRVSELVSIQTHEVNFMTEEVILHGKGNKDRQSFINAKCRVALKEYLNSRTDDEPYLIVMTRAPHTNVTSRSIEILIKAIATRAGLTSKITPHTLRRTAATNAAKKGMPIQLIQKWLGHSNIQTTMRYVGVSEEQVHNKFIMVMN